MSVQGIMEADAAVKNAKARLLEAVNDKRVQDAEARADTAEAVIQKIAKQWLPAELEEYTGDTDADYEAGYVSCVKEARAFLAETAPKPVRLGDEGEGKG